MNKVQLLVKRLAKPRLYRYSTLYRIQLRPFSTIQEDNQNKLYEHIHGKSVVSSIDNDSEYRSDERSGDEVSDTDKEFDSIVEIDAMLKSLSENTFEVQELHQKLNKLFTMLYDVRDLIEFDSEILKNIFTTIIPQEMPFFSTYNQVLKIADLAYRMQISYKEFWQGVIHTLLLYYPEMDLTQIIPLCYYLSKAGIKDLVLEPSSLPEQFKAKAAKLSKTASHQLMIAHFKELLVDQDLTDVMVKYKLAYLLKASNLSGSNLLMSKDNKNQFVKDLMHYFSDNMQGLTFVISEFNYDQCIDFLKICPDNQLSTNIFGLLIALFNDNSSKKKFYDGRKPTVQDVNLILNKMKYLQQSIESDELKQMIEIVRFILQKAITRNTKDKPKSSSTEEVVLWNDIQQDLEFIQILKNHADLNIVDHKTALLLLFEIQSQLQQERPFNSNDEASAKLSLILHTLRNYDFKDGHAISFLQAMNTHINSLIYQSDEFDEYLDVSEYILLREISKRFKELFGNNEKISQQIEYLERKIFNYSQLYTI